MKQSDITIGGEYGVRDYTSVSKVRVIEVGVATRSYSTRKDGVRVEDVEAYGSPLRGSRVVSTRDLVEWDTKMQERGLLIEAQRAWEDRVDRIGERLGVPVRAASHNTSVYLAQDDFLALAVKLGVDTD